MFEKLQEETIYGPVNSRRLGKSIGINLYPNDQEKYCSFNCKYCYFKTESKKISSSSPINNITSHTVIDELDNWRNTKQDIFTNADFITFSGNGEPSIHPFFPEILNNVIEWRNRKATEKKVAIFTNGSSLQDLNIKNAILQCDEIFIKLDVGNQSDFISICRPNQPILYDDYVRNIKSIVDEAKVLKRNLTIQTAILETNQTHNDGIDIHSWVKQIKFINPQRVDLYELNFDGTNFEVREFFDYRKYFQTISKFFENVKIEIRFFTKYPTRFHEVYIQYAVDGLLYLPVYIADKANLFYRNGIEPRFRESSNGDLGAIKAVINGTTDFALCDPFVVFSDEILKEERSKCSLVEIIINKVGLWSVCDGQINDPKDVFQTKDKIYTYLKGSTAHKIAEWFNQNRKVIKSNNPGREFDFACYDKMQNNVDPIDSNAIITADLLTSNVCLRCWRNKDNNCSRKILNLSDEKSLNPFLFTGLIVNTGFFKDNSRLAKKVIDSINEAILIFQDGSYLRHRKVEFIDYLNEKISRKSPLFMNCSQAPNIRIDLDLSLEQLRQEDIYEPKSILNVTSLINAFHLHNSFNKSISLTEFYKYLKYYNTKNKFRMFLLKIFLAVLWFRIKFLPKKRIWTILFLLISTILCLSLNYAKNEVISWIGNFAAIASILGLLFAILYRR
ncbi:MAG: 4Fe-4S cluster-binding domain-containing protein [Bacteroidales bacterium]|nr:4Fe-4S cluster-binding domain-containing protein [Bacteroidales bacterium]